MRRFLMSAAVAALTVAIAGPSQASGPGKNSGGSSRGSSRSNSSSHYNSYSHSSYSKGSYHDTYGTKFSHGYFYSGRNHSHWSYRCWSNKYGCECCYCPSTCCWYYWYEPSCCYYPVSYFNSAPSKVIAAPVVSQVASQSVVVNSPGAVLPPAGPDGGPLPPK